MCFSCSSLRPPPPWGSGPAPMSGGIALLLFWQGRRWPWCSLAGWVLAGTSRVHSCLGRSLLPRWHFRRRALPPTSPRDGCCWEGVLGGWVLPGTGHPRASRRAPCFSYIRVLAVAGTVALAPPGIRLRKWAVPAPASPAANPSAVPYPCGFPIGARAMSALPGENGGQCGGHGGCRAGWFAQHRDVGAASLLPHLSMDVGELRSPEAWYL